MTWRCAPRRGGVVLLFGIVLAGCTTNPDLSPAANSPGPAPSEAHSSGAESGADWIHAHPPGEDWEVLSEEEMLAIRTKAMEFEAKSLAMIDVEVPPDPGIDRWLEVGEWGHVMAECIQQGGFDAFESQGGFGVGDRPLEQEGALRLVIYDCKARFPSNPYVNQPLPRVRAEQQYHYLVDSVVPCLEDLGYPVQEPPSLDVWLSDYYQGKGEEWSPFRYVSVFSANEMDMIYDECPKFPPDLFPPTPTTP